MESFCKRIRRVINPCQNIANNVETNRRIDHTLPPDGLAKTEAERLRRRSPKLRTCARNKLKQHPITSRWTNGQGHKSDCIPERETLARWTLERAKTSLLVNRYPTLPARATSGAARRTGYAQVRGL